MYQRAPTQRHEPKSATVEFSAPARPRAYAHAMSSSQADVIVVDATGLDTLIQQLRDEGRTVIGPLVGDGVITHGEIEHGDDLPRGWTEEQEGGTYRLVPTNTEERFAWSTPSTSWKRHLQPEKTLLIRARRKAGRIEILDDPVPTPSLAFFGIRSCDLASIGILDRVFLDPAATDPTYAARRADVFIVAAACNSPGNTCFCASMDTGPTPRDGYDLAIREVVDGDQITYQIEAGSSRGTEMIAGLHGREATAAECAASGALHDRAVAGMGRTMSPDDPPLAAAAIDHPRWDDVADRCLACGNCTMVCPTCFCSTTEDHTDLTGSETERWKVWESCFSLDFTHLHGGSVRTSTKSRYRQWLLHKLVTWHDQYGSSGCVGCGRCITWCPVGIDLLDEVAALREAPP